MRSFTPTPCAISCQSNLPSLIKTTNQTSSKLHKTSTQAKPRPSLLGLPNELLLSIFDILAEPLRVTHAQDGSKRPADEDQVQKAAADEGLALVNLGMTCKFLRNSIQNHFWPNRLTFSHVDRCYSKPFRWRTRCVPLIQTPFAAVPLRRAIVPRVKQQSLVRRLEINADAFWTLRHIWNQNLRPLYHDDLYLNGAVNPTASFFEKISGNYSLRKAAKRIDEAYGNLTGVKDLTIVLEGVATLNLMNLWGGDLPAIISAGHTDICTTFAMLHRVWEYLLRCVFTNCKRVSVRRVPLKIDDFDPELRAATSHAVFIPSDYFFDIHSHAGDPVLWPFELVDLGDLPEFLARADEVMGAELDAIVAEHVKQRAEKTFVDGKVVAEAPRKRCIVQ